MITSSKEIQEDSSIDQSLRPQTFEDYIGQDQIKKNLSISIQAAQKRGDALDHLLFYGPPGLGKTSLAYLIAKYLGSNMKVTSGPALEKAGDLASILTNIESGDILFIDEIHRLSKTLEEILYSAMEDFVLDIIVGKGPSARTLRLDLPKFTLIGATTKFGSLSGPFRSRFGNIYSFDFYNQGHIIDILDYTNTNKVRTVRSLRGQEQDSPGTVGLHSYLYNSTTAISRLDFVGGGGDIVQYSSFALYGIKGA